MQVYLSALFKQMQHGVPISIFADTLRIVARTTLSTRDPLVRATTCLEWLAHHLDSVGATLTLLTQPHGPGSIQLERMADIGVWGPVERAARDAYFKNPDHASDPFAAKYCERDLTQQPQSAIREDCLPDDEWYTSPHVLGFRKRAEMDSAIYASVPVRGRKADQVRLFGISLNRRWGAAPFTHADRDFALAFLEGLSPLLKEVWREDVSSTDAAFEEIPMRFRKVLSALLAGRTEREVAADLVLSQQTVHTYVKQIYLHFGVNSRAQLQAWFASANPAGSLTEAGEIVCESE